MVLRSDRAVSTVLDVVTCLLLVTAAVGVHFAAQSPQQRAGGEREAAAVADVLTTSTAQVEYSVRPASAGEAAPEYPDASATAYERSAHGTPGELLAAAAVADARLEGKRVLPYTDFRDRAAGATENRVDPVADRIRIVARWEPYPGAPINGTVEVGSQPPPDADVEAATATVSVGEGCSNERLRSVAHHHEFGGLSRLISECVVRTWFPPDGTRTALAGRPPAPAIAEHRYRRAAAAIGVSLDGAAASGDVEAANGRLIDRLSDRLDADVRERYETPPGAAKAASVDRATITVRTW